MLKNKKSFAVILSLVMLLAMACGAWAADAIISADGVSKTGQVGPINVVSDNVYGLWAQNGGYIEFTGDITTGGDRAHGAYLLGVGSSADITGNITTKGAVVWAVNAYGGTGRMTGDITSMGVASRGLMAHTSGAYINLVGSIDVVADRGVGAYAHNGGIVVMVGNVSILGPGTDVGSRYCYGVGARINGANIDVTGNVSASGENAFALWAGETGTVTLRKGEIKVSSDDSAWAMAVVDRGTINLIDVVVDSNNKNLLKNDTYTYGAGISPDYSGTVHVENSSLFGNILQIGLSSDVLALTLVDSALNGAANAEDESAIDITLIDSNWNITGDSNTNGTITGDGNSIIDYSLSPEETTAIIETLKGNAGVNMKIGDKLIIRNPDGEFSSNSPDVIEVVVDDVTKEVSIISKADGEAELTYSYIDENNKIQTVTVTVVSGAGSDPESNNYGGGGSSNCSAGFGAMALFSLLGLALVMKPK